MKSFSHACAIILGMAGLVQSARSNHGRSTFGKCVPIIEPSFKSGVTAGRAASFTVGGTEAGFTCRRLSTHENPSCNDFVQPIGDAIGSILLSVAGNGPVCNGSSMTGQRKRELTGELQNNVIRMLEGKAFESVTTGKKMARDLEKSDLSVQIKGMAHEGGKTDVEVRQSSEGFGSASIRPKSLSPRQEDSSGGNGRGGSDGPGFKITYKSYPENYINREITTSAASSLGDQMAKSWANSSVNHGNSSRYFGVFSQQFRPILLLQIIPQIRGFGDDFEDPEEPCGSLKRFACDDPRNSTCDALFKRSILADQCTPDTSHSSNALDTASDVPAPSGVISYDDTSVSLTSESAAVNSSLPMSGTSDAESTTSSRDDTIAEKEAAIVSSEGSSAQLSESEHISSETSMAKEGQISERATQSNNRPSTMSNAEVAQVQVINSVSAGFPSSQSGTTSSATTTSCFMSSCSERSSHIAADYAGASSFQVVADVSKTLDTASSTSTDGTRPTGVAIVTEQERKA